MKNNPVYVVKVGGNILDSDALLEVFLRDLAAITLPMVLVHGGGKLATELSAQLGIETRMVNGRRITDAATVRVVTMTYAGWINKKVVAALNVKGCRAIGMCGADGGLLPAVKRPVADVDYGYVGDLFADKVNVQLLTLLLQQGLVPVIAPVTSGKEGELLNVNADTVAETIAVALSQQYDTTLVYCFEKKGLLSDVNRDDSVIHRITRHEAEHLKSSGVITGGMIPKIDNALNAIDKGVKRVVIGHAAEIKQLVTADNNYGTSIVN